jgi:hypothetical protein
MARSPDRGPLFFSGSLITRGTLPDLWLAPHAWFTPLLKARSAYRYSHESWLAPGLGFSRITPARSLAVVHLIALARSHVCGPLRNFGSLIREWCSLDTWLALRQRFTSDLLARSSSMVPYLPDRGAVARSNPWVLSAYLARS